MHAGRRTPRSDLLSVRVSQLSSTGELDVTVNMEKVLSEHDGPKDLDSLVGKYLYITVHLQEDTGTRQHRAQVRSDQSQRTHSHEAPPPIAGGIAQDAEFSSVKFVKSPYSLSLVSTSTFIKPELPYNIQVCSAAR